MTEGLYGSLNVEEKIKLFTRKCVFRYDYVKNMEVLNETSLPPREAFYNRLSGSECSPADYAHAQNVRYTFGIRTLKEYLELYLFADVCQLADVFESYRETCITAYKLDPAYFLSAPQLAWNAFLRYIKPVIELMYDAEMYRMI